MACWAIRDSTLYLTHVRECGTHLALGADDEGVTSPLMATWLSGEWRASRGAVLGFTMEQGALAETGLTFTLDQGAVTEVEENGHSGAGPER